MNTRKTPRRRLARRGVRFKEAISELHRMATLADSEAKEVTNEHLEWFLRKWAEEIRAGANHLEKGLKAVHSSWKK